MGRQCRFVPRSPSTRKEGGPVATLHYKAVRSIRLRSIRQRLHRLAHLPPPRPPWPKRQDSPRREILQQGPPGPAQSPDSSVVPLATATVIRRLATYASAATTGGG